MGVMFARVRGLSTAIPAQDLTTNELARQLKLSDIPAEWSTQVIEVLRVCDTVKFANDVLELTTIHGLIDTAERLVTQYPVGRPAQPATSGPSPLNETG